MALIPDFAALLRNATTLQAPGGATYGDGTRVPMVFTSTLRQRTAAFTPRRTDRVSIAPAGRPSADVQTTDRLESEFFRGAQVALLPFIELSINPTSIDWTQSKRITEKKLLEGSVFYHFVNRRGQDNDILRMQFEGTTGNIDPRGSVDGGADTGALKKLIEWHNLYLLTREPVLLEDYTENRFTITYVSTLFPQAINFNGFFSEVLKFREDGDEPNSRSYSFEFVVTSTEPNLDEIMDTVLTVLQDTSLTPTDNSTLLGNGTGVVSP